MTARQDWVRDGKPFSGEADLEHEWAKRWRIPLVHSWNPRWKYEVALVVPPVTVWDHINFVWPTEAEAAVIGWFIECRMDYYNDRWRKQMRHRPLDVDDSTNTVILAKVDDHWHYAMATWRSGPPLAPLPYPTENAGPSYVGREGLIELITKRVFGHHDWSKHEPVPHKEN